MTKHIDVQKVIERLERAIESCNWTGHFGSLTAQGLEETVRLIKAQEALIMQRQYQTTDWQEVQKEAERMFEAFRAQHELQSDTE